uniref:Otopetrin-2 n=1 Tax=Daphnia galeata TaxID=27404 RepID=A0A8J2RD56_9CRUS|nr:unnamed protein product [Daphnia galeata]
MILYTFVLQLSRVAVYFRSHGSEEESTVEAFQGDEEMQIIEIKPMIINQDEENEAQVDCILTDTVETEMLISRSDLVAVCVNSSDRIEAEEEMMMAVSMLSSDPSRKSDDSCDAGVPLLTPTQQNEKHRRSLSPHWAEPAEEQTDDGEEFQQQISISKTPRYSWSRNNSSTEQIRRYTRSARCLTPMPSTFNVLNNNVNFFYNVSVEILSRPDSLDNSNALLTVISALYAKLLVVMGLAFPMTEVISNHVPSFSYLGFYLYLYFGSIAYFFFVFFTMLKNRAAKGNRYFGCGSMKPIKVLFELKQMNNNYQFEDSPSRTIDNMGTQNYGSFYLRIGAVAFGVGSMIYSGLEFAQYFESDPGSECHNILMAVTPAARMIFTFIQMYFIFLNAKMAVYCKPRAIAYFGLMHVVATNLCVWLNVIIEETKHEILHQFSHQESNGHYNHNTQSTTVQYSEMKLEYGGFVAESDALTDNSLVDECKRSEMMGNVVQDASQFLFPCAIEYSLICAAILYIMWKNVSMSEDGAIYVRSNSGGSAVGRRSRHQYSVDCAKANKGLFAGIFVLVGIIISLVLFYALINNDNFRALAIMEVAVSRLLLFCAAFIATIIGIYQIRELEFDSSRHFGLDAVLLVVAQVGLMAYKIFTVIACCYSIKSDDGNSTLVLLSALAAILQAVAQTLFILDASRRHTYTADQQSRKPGREVVTFLLMCNFAMWSVNTLEKSRADANPLQLEFFGMWPWIIIMNVSMPLTIFFRFHSTVVLCEIWKRCYKVKPDLM